MKAGHRAVATPLGLTYSWVAYEVGGVNPIVAAPLAFMVVWTCHWPDYDHPNYKGRMLPHAAAVRASAWIGYKFRTAKDRQREDFHRGPSHCVEWCVLLGLLFFWALWRVGVPIEAAGWFSGAITVGAASHIAGDVPTPSGAPVSAIYNYFRHGEVWKRHSLGWFATDSAGERFAAIPVAYGLALLEGLAMLGMLGPIWDVLSGGIDRRIPLAGLVLVLVAGLVWLLRPLVETARQNVRRRTAAGWS